MDNNGRILAVDYGEKNIGLACSDPFRLLAQPMPSIPNSGWKNFTGKIKSMVREMDIRELIFGIPLNMNGSRNDAVVKMEKVISSNQRH